MDLKPSGYKLVKLPEPGEYVVLHFWLKTTTRRGEKEGKFMRAIAVGKQPWGVRGARTGQCVDGEIVVVTDEPENKAFDLLFLDLLTRAVQINPQDSDVVSVAGEMAVEIKSRGVANESLFSCPRCRSAYTETSGNFCKKASVAWYVMETSQYDGNIGKFSNSLCIACLKNFKKKIKESIAAKKDYPEESKVSLAKYVATSLAANSYIDPVHFVDPLAYEPVLDAVDSLISEIK